MNRDSDEDIIELEDDHDEDEDRDGGDFDDNPKELLEWARERKNTFLIGGGIILVLIIFGFFFSPDQGNFVSKEDLTALILRVDRIEARVGQLDGLETAIVNLLEAQKSLPDEEALAARLDILAGTVEVLQQKFGSVVAPSPAPGQTVRYHTVKPGETLFGIARMYNIPLDRLYELNKMTSRDTLRVDQRLIISP